MTTVRLIVEEFVIWFTQTPKEHASLIYHKKKLTAFVMCEMFTRKITQMQINNMDFFHIIFLYYIELNILLLLLLLNILSLLLLLNIFTKILYLGYPFLNIPNFNFLDIH